MGCGGDECWMLEARREAEVRVFEAAMTPELLSSAMFALLRPLLQVTFSLMASAGSIPSSAALDSLLCAGSSDQSVIVFAVEPVPIIVVAGRSRRAFNGRLHGLVSLSILSVIIWSEFIHPI